MEVESKSLETQARVTRNGAMHEKVSESTDS